MPRTLLMLGALLTTVVAAAGCGNATSSSSGGASLAPSGSLVYGEADLHPQGGQKAAVESLIEKFPGRGSAGERVRSLLDSLLEDSDAGISYTHDVEPWLGDRAAFFVSGLGASGADPGAALLVATTDQGKSRDAIEKAGKGEGRAATYKGHDYRTFPGDGAAGVVDDWVVLGNAAGFKSAVDTAEGGRSLDEDDRYQRALRDASDERLGFIYLNSPALADVLKRSGSSFAQFGAFFKDPLLATVNADSKGVRIEAAVPESLASSFPPLAQGSDIAGALPADSWLAIGQPDLGRTVDQLLDLFSSQLGGRAAVEAQIRQATGLDLHDDVLSWMGDWGLFVRGTSVDELNGALIVESKDEAASARTIDAVARLARRSAGGDEKVVPYRAGGGRGWTLRTPSIPQPIHLFQRDGRVVLAYGDAAARDALDPPRKLSDSAAYADAQDSLGGDYALSFYLAVDPILQLVDSTSAGSDEGWRKARPYLEPLGTLAGGARKDGDELDSAIGVSIR